jgi:hypothetical protein
MRDVAIRSRCWRLELDKPGRSLFVPNYHVLSRAGAREGAGDPLQSVNAVQKSALAVQL